MKQCRSPCSRSQGTELITGNAEFSFILIGKSTMAFLTDQSWRVLKSWYTAGGQEQRFRRCFADGLNQSLVLPGAQANHLSEHV